MNKAIYVNGGVLIKTPNFRYLDAGALFEIPQKGMDIIEPEDDIDGQPCLVITDKKAPSFFKRYYAKTFFSTMCKIAPFFSYSIGDAYVDLENRISDVLNLITKNDVCSETRQNLYRMCLVAAVAALDTYISDIVLFVATKDTKIFLKTAKKFCQNKSADIIARIALMWSDNTLDSAEQEVIDSVLKTSYSNLKRIKDDVLTELYGVKIQNALNIDDIFLMRHIIVHRSGRRKDWKDICFSKDELLSIIDRIKLFATAIHDCVKNSDIVTHLR